VRSGAWLLLEPQSGVLGKQANAKVRFGLCCIRGDQGIQCSWHYPCGGSPVVHLSMIIDTATRSQGFDGAPREEKKSTDILSMKSVTSCHLLFPGTCTRPR
jgi:hypothetical protein